MKKIAIIVVVAIVLLAFVGCGGMQKKLENQDWGKVGEKQLKTEKVEDYVSQNHGKTEIFVVRITDGELFAVILKCKGLEVAGEIRDEIIKNVTTEDSPHIKIKYYLSNMKTGAKQNGKYVMMSRSNVLLEKFENI